MLKQHDDDVLKEDMRHFENFLKAIGFKRIEGSVYGLLIISPHALSSEEIQTQLGLSQAAVSNALKTLSFYGAVETTLSREKGCRVYDASEDCLSIVSNVLQKREAIMIREYKIAVQGILTRMLRNGISSVDPRVKRLRSIVTTCELGEAIIGFTTSLDSMRLKEKLSVITERLPQIFHVIVTGAEFAHDSAGVFKDKFGLKLKTYLKAFKGEERGQ